MENKELFKQRKYLEETVNLFRKGAPGETIDHTEYDHLHEGQSDTEMMFCPLCRAELLTTRALALTYNPESQEEPGQGRDVDPESPEVVVGLLHPEGHLPAS